MKTTMNIGDYNELSCNLELLGLNKIKENIGTYLDKNIFDNSQLIPFLNTLLKEEILFRDERAREINIFTSNFPYRKTIKDFDFDFQPGLSKKLIMDLMTLRFIENSENIIFQGLPGTGKTMLSTCIGTEAASKRISTYFVSCAKLLNDLKKARYENRFDRRLKQFCGYKLLIIDELGFLPIEKEEANLLFQLISARYEKKSTIITTNIEFSKWGETLHDPLIASAILDRLLHHCTVIQIDGPSYRTKDILTTQK